MLTVKDFPKMKADGKIITSLTAYDYSSAQLTELAGVDFILVGDSLGMVVLGYESTIQVTMEDMLHHIKAVKRGTKDTFIVADMPYKSFHISTERTKENAFRLIIEGGANAVKLEGGTSSRLDAIRAIVDCEIPVVAHLGLTPQSVNKFGGYKVQGKAELEYQKLIQQSKDVEEAGAFMLVLEGIPEQLGKEISETLTIPTIGIGAGRYTDGQILVYHDLLGLTALEPKFLKKYTMLNDEIVKAVAQYVSEVREKKFPQEKHVYFPIK
ncbi:MAG: 3-methyl-2-oxobutanoate hydroxymethyltransferase [Candidatus Cloacimonetes bacterium]|nr:3-methyl-2-oxobutanoate hydroxymethyltransferase [Candidatus Cloacimonadota bacterium]